MIEHRGGPPRSDWWKDAACTRHDPEWWSDDRVMRQAAVRICLTCPVRRACIADATRAGDTGVVRGAMLFTRTSQDESSIVSLVCVQCGVRPVNMTKTGQDTLCVRCRLTIAVRHAPAA